MSLFQNIWLFHILKCPTGLIHCLINVSLQRHCPAFLKPEKCLTVPYFSIVTSSCQYSPLFYLLSSPLRSTDTVFLLVVCFYVSFLVFTDQNGQLVFCAAFIPFLYLRFSITHSFPFITLFIIPCPSLGPAQQLQVAFRRGRTLFIFSILFL